MGTLCSSTCTLPGCPLACSMLLCMGSAGHGLMLILSMCVPSRSKYQLHRCSAIAADLCCMLCSVVLVCLACVTCCVQSCVCAWPCAVLSVLIKVDSTLGCRCTAATLGISALVPWPNAVTPSWTASGSCSRGSSMWQCAVVCSKYCSQTCLCGVALVRHLT